MFYHIILCYIISYYVISRRKKLHNAIEDLKGSIRVFCRIRPLSGTEKDLLSLTLASDKSGEKVP